MKKYLTTSYNTRITEVEVLRETESSVCIPHTYGKKKEKYVLKMTNCHQYHDTWGQAHEYLLEQAQLHVIQAENRLSYEATKLEKIEAMKEDI